MSSIREQSRGRSRSRPDGSIVAYGVPARPGADSEEMVRELCASVQERARLLHVGLRVSIGLTILALGLIVLAYVLDKAFLDG